MPDFALIPNLLMHQPVPEDGILTRQLLDDEKVRLVLFTFSPGQRLSEHTASTLAFLQFLSGEATVTLGKDRVEVGPGAWVRMDPGLAHSIVTKSKMVMLLTLIKGSPAK